MLQGVRMALKVHRLARTTVAFEMQNACRLLAQVDAVPLCALATSLHIQSSEESHAQS